MSEVEVITACENVCGDFFWIAPLASVLADFGTFAVGFGVIAGFYQLKLWKTAAKSRSRAEAAEFCLTAVLNADEALKLIRQPFGKIPKEATENRTEYYLFRKRRIFDREETFAALRKAEVRQEVLIGDSTVSKAIDELFRIRNEIVWAIDKLIQSEHVDTPEARELRVECERCLNGSYSDQDALGMKQTRAIDAIKEVLLPIARYDKH